VDGELERAEAEWLHTNGAGAYAMSTLALMHTRRHHGLLVAALEPPLRRYMILSHAETTVTVADKAYKLATHQFPNVAPTLGYRNLRTFAQDPLPRWIYRLGKSLLERTLALARGENTLILRYRWLGKTPARLSLMPLMPLRPLEHLAREHGGMLQRVTLRPGEVEIQPLSALPSVTFGHRGVFMGSPDWWRRFEYYEDLRRYSDFQEDMWTPGTFEMTIDPDGEVYLTASVGAPASAAPEVLMDRARDYLLARDPGPDAPGHVRSLCLAADSFAATAAPRSTILAGLPWLGVSLRDWLIALPGVLLAPGRVEEAKASLESVLALLRGGLLPAELRDSTEPPARRSPDATLWLFQAAGELAEALGLDHPFVRGPLWSGLVRAFLRLRGRGRTRLVWVTHDGLIAVVPSDGPATWMDACAEGRAVTARAGLAIEMQALWFSACRLLGAWAHHYRAENVERAAREALEAVRTGFSHTYWCNETDYPFDCVSVERQSADSWADMSIRPNAVIALAVAPELFEPWQRDAILALAKRELLTTRGLRTLAPTDPNYQGHYEGTSDERERALHQGSVWPFLLGFYVRAVLDREPDPDDELRAELVDLIEKACEVGPVLGHVTQLADGDEPHRQRGCPAQAWSVATLYHALAIRLGRR
jgi:predicted glycogen debranching enzyme